MQNWSCLQSFNFAHLQAKSSQLFLNLKVFHQPFFINKLIDLCVLAAKFSCSDKNWSVYDKQWLKLLNDIYKAENCWTVWRNPPSTKTEAERSKHSWMTSIQCTCAGVVMALLTYLLLCFRRMKSTSVISWWSGVVSPVHICSILWCVVQERRKHSWSRRGCY